MTTWCTAEAVQGEGAALQQGLGAMVLRWCCGACTVPKYGTTELSWRYQMAHSPNQVRCTIGGHGLYTPSHRDKRCDASGLTSICRTTRRGDALHKSNKSGTACAGCKAATSFTLHTRALIERAAR